MAINIADMLMRAYVQDFFSGDDTTQAAKGELSLKSAQRVEDLSDVVLLESMLKDATTAPEINLVNQTNKEVQKRAADKDPIIQAGIKAVGLEIEEHTNLFTQFETATNNVYNMMKDGEFEEIDIENMTFDNISEETTNIRRFKHLMDLGIKKGLSHTPEGSKISSQVIENRLKEHSEKLDAAVHFLIDKGKGKNLPVDAKRAIQIGDLATLKEIKARELTLAQRNYSSHSSRYSSLNNEKMKADTKENIDSGQVPLMPSTMMADLKNQGEDQTKAFMDAIKGDPMLYQAFMGGLKSGSGITVDYDTYSKLLEKQMVFESNNVKESNQSYFDWTGSNMEKFREAPDYSKIKEELDKTGLKDDIDDDTKDEKIDYSGESVETAIEEPDIDEEKERQVGLYAEEPRFKKNRDVGIFQINEPTFAKYNPSGMNETEMIEFASKIVYNQLPDSTVGAFNNNDGWNNWSVYKNKTKDYRLARNKTDGWLLKNGMTQEQLDTIDANFTTKKDRNKARSVIWAESKGEHSAININEPKMPIKEPAKAKGVAISESLSKTYTNERELRYGKPVIPNTSKPFKSAQSNLSSIASDKFNKLNSKDKNKYKGNKKESVRAFVKDKFEEWLRKAGRYGKPYGEGDFIYFMPTKVDASGKVNKEVPSANLYTLHYPGAFKKGFPSGIFTVPTKGYAKFAKDFDKFREFLQKS